MIQNILIIDGGNGNTLFQYMNLINNKCTSITTTTISILSYFKNYYNQINKIKKFNIIIIQKLLFHILNGISLFYMNENLIYDIIVCILNNL